MSTIHYKLTQFELHLLINTCKRKKFVAEIRFFENFRIIKRIKRGELDLQPLLDDTEKKVALQNYEDLKKEKSKRIKKEHLAVDTLRLDQVI